MGEDSDSAEADEIQKVLDLEESEEIVVKLDLQQNSKVIDEPQRIEEVDEVSIVINEQVQDNRVEENLSEK